ncbi:unnamed protein product, partial [Mesorhabditis spiculigera]
MGTKTDGAPPTPAELDKALLKLHPTPISPMGVQQQPRPKEPVPIPMPECQTMTGAQIGMQMRKFHKKHLAKHLSDPVHRVVFEDSDIGTESAKRQSSLFLTRTPARKNPQNHPDSTDVSDVELEHEEMDSVTLNYLEAQRLAQRNQLVRIDGYLDDMKMQRAELQRHQALIEANKKANSFETHKAAEDEESCARIRLKPRPFWCTVTREKLPEKPPIDFPQFEPSTSNTMSRYAFVDDRVHMRITPGVEEVPFSRRSEAIFHQLSIAPELSKRRRIDQCAWKNIDLMGSEESRCLPNPYIVEEEPKARRPSGSLKTRFQDESEKDSDFEYESDDEVCLPKSKRREARKKDRKKRAEDPKPRSSVPQRRFDIDDVVIDYGGDYGISGLPEKIEYKEISTPGFREFVFPEDLVLDCEPEAARQQDAAHRQFLEELHAEKLANERRAPAAEKKTKPEFTIDE